MPAMHGALRRPVPFLGTLAPLLMLLPACLAPPYIRTSSGAPASAPRPQRPFPKCPFPTSEIPCLYPACVPFWHTPNPPCSPFAMPLPPVNPVLHRSPRLSPSPHFPTRLVSAFAVHSSRHVACSRQTTSRSRPRFSMHACVPFAKRPCCSAPTSSHDAGCPQQLCKTNEPSGPWQLADGKLLTSRGVCGAVSCQTLRAPRPRAARASAGC